MQVGRTSTSERSWARLLRPHARDCSEAAQVSGGLLELRSVLPCRVCRRNPARCFGGVPMSYSCCTARPAQRAAPPAWSGARAVVAGHVPSFPCGPALLCRLWRRPRPVVPGCRRPPGSAWHGHRCRRRPQPPFLPQPPSFFSKVYAHRLMYGRIYGAVPSS